MRVRDVFEGYAVKLHPYGEEWALSILDATGQVALIKLYAFSDDAVADAYLWLLALASPEQVQWEKVQVAESDIAYLMREHLHSLLVEQEDMYELFLEPEDAQLRAWYEREMKTAEE
jgi:hypothetical protein